MDFATWLARREPYDHEARDEALTHAFVAALPPRPHVVDLATGRGSNVRYLRRWLPGARFTGVDRDPALLALLDDQVTPLEHDVRRGLGVLPPAHGLATTALLDLVDHDFLERLVAYCQQRGLPLLATLSVDGRLSWSQPHPDDARVHGWFRAHQHTDRGFGPSVGVQAVPVLAELLVAAGATVRTARADWRLPAGDAAFVAELTRGIAQAARECAHAPAVVDAWLAWRLAHPCDVTVGHLDLLALPAGEARSA